MKELNDLINQLKFFGIKEGLEYRLTQAMKDNTSYQDFLTLLFEDERLYRENCRSSKLRKRAKFKDRASLEEFDCSTQRGVSKSMIRQMQTLHFMNSYENLIFYGQTGAGKSYLAQAIGHTACQSGKETLFISVNILFHQIQAAEKSGTYLSFLQRMAKAQLLILDDFALRNYTHQEATILYQILDDRYHKASTIITSQVKPLGWKNLFEDPVIAEAIINRMSSCAHSIELKNGNYRNNHSPKKKITIDEIG